VRLNTRHRSGSVSPLRKFFIPEETCVVLKPSATFSRSRSWKCPTCQKTNLECLPDPHENKKEATESSSSTGNSALDEVKSTDTSVMESTATPPLTDPTATPEPLPVPGSEIVLPQEAAEPRLVIPGPAAPPLTTSPGSRETEAHGQPTSTARAVVQPPSQVVAIARRPSSQPRSPILLDTAIGVLAILVVALLCRRIL
jgi:ubiquitin-conjugating enzyme E2 J1